MSMPLTEHQKGVYCGIAIALGTLNHGFDEPTVCGDVLKNLGIRYSEFVKAGVDPLDLAELRQIRRKSDWERSQSDHAAAPAPEARPEP